MSAELINPIGKLIEANKLSGYKPDTIVRRATYVESFAVGDQDPTSRAELVQKRLLSLTSSQKSSNFRPVLICISTSGIKICSADGTSVLMAHALRRISYSNFESKTCLLAFVAREPNSNVKSQFGHIFRTETVDLADELNRIIGEAFKIAFSKQSLLRSSISQKEMDKSLAQLPLLSHQFPICPPPETTALMGLEIPPPPSSEPPLGVNLRMKLTQPESQPKKISNPIAPERKSGRLLSNLKLSSSRSPSRNRLPESMLHVNYMLDLRNFDSNLGSPVVFLKQRIESTSCEQTPSPPLPPIRINSLRRMHTNNGMSKLQQQEEAKHKTQSNDNLSSSLSLISGGLPVMKKVSVTSAKFNAPWYQASIPRDVALEMLSRESTGSFIVRDSVSHPNCCALSVKVDGGITHYLIERSDSGGVKLQRFDKEWPTLHDLIMHLTVKPEILPCILKLPPSAPSSNHSNPNFDQHEGTGNGASSYNQANWQEEASEEVDEDYQKLSDFSTLLISANDTPQQPVQCK